MKDFSSLVVDRQNNQLLSTIKTMTLEDLSLGEVVIAVHYSSINYKDSLAPLANGGVVRTYPMIPGIDLGGIVLSSTDERFVTGQEVLVTGYEIGVSHTGGFSEIARVPADWVVPLPKNLSLKDAMVIGTAGITAALSIQYLEKNGLSQKKDATILVTGASGGVGSLSISMLKQLGYSSIFAMTRKKELIPTLQKLGATDIILTNDFLSDQKKSLMKQKFHFVIDTVGGELTSNILPQIYFNGSLALSGNVGGIKLSTTVLPFILRGISLLGVDSVHLSMSQRTMIWENLANFSWQDYFLVNEISLQNVLEIMNQLQETSHIGRTIVNLQKGASL